ncbi:MAG: DMT family transporter [Actinomycetota bacterium]|nr:DMT family transporter [Actinomycetota bacterium]
MAVFAKEAYRSGVSVRSLLALRFAIAAGAFWAIVAIRSRPPARLPTSDASSRRLTLTGLALGLGYAAQAGGYFGALTRIDASLTSLLLYVYPALVFAGAVLLGRERPDNRRVGALVLASGGVVLVLAGGGAGALDGLGVALGLLAAVCYAAYILVTDVVVGAFDPFRLGALVTTGAAVAMWTAGLLTGGIDVHFAAAGWAWVVALALISTVGAVTAFTLGLARVGPSTASIVSTIEPVVTVGLVMAVFGERLTPVQLAGGALVLAAVILLQVRGSVRAHVPPADGPAPPPAGAFAHQPARG